MRKMRVGFAYVVAVMGVVGGMSGAGWGKDAPSYVNEPDSWYSTAEGKQVVKDIISWQMPGGGWEKAYDALTFNTDPDPKAHPHVGSAAAQAALAQEGPGVWDVATLDNNATHSELRILAKAVTLTGNEAAKEAFFKGFDWLLKAQYPNGGWPQRFPPGDNYGRYITFNDDAMIGAMRVLRGVAKGEPMYGFVDSVRREKAQRAVEKGVECILNCQIVRDGELTGWCAQHDEKTLAPAPARAYELPSLSGDEGAGVAIFLMHLEHPSARVKKAIEGAAKWFDEVKIEGKGVKTVHDADGKKDRVVVDEPGSVIWARFYDIKTDKPFFCGRDGVKKAHLADIERERRAGYTWYGPWGKAVAEEYAAWKKREGG